jgi:hypothetical protein
VTAPAPRSQPAHGQNPLLDLRSATPQSGAPKTNAGTNGEFPRRASRLFSVRTKSLRTARYKPNNPVTIVEPCTEPDAAVTVTGPTATITSTPCGVTVARIAGDTVHVTLPVMFAVEPSE